MYYIPSIDVCLFRGMNLSNQNCIQDCMSCSNLIEPLSISLSCSYVNILNHSHLFLTVSRPLLQSTHQSLQSLVSQFVSWDCLMELGQDSWSSRSWALNWTPTLPLRLMKMPSRCGTITMFGYLVNLRILWKILYIH